MPDQIHRDIDEWRLGIESGEHLRPEAQPPSAIGPADLSVDRLDAPLYVVTVDRLGWAVVALYALITRLGVLGLRPLGSAEARDALCVRDIARHGLEVLASNPQTGSGWLEPLRAAFLIAFGASDFSARMISALFGLFLIAAAFAMRRRLGRAGALAFATMMTLSPTVTYFSRSTSPVVPAAALIVIAIAVMLALIGNADTGKVIGLACAIALALSTAAVVVPIAVILVLILILLGIYELIVGRNPTIRFRVWWERRSAQFLFAGAIVVALFFAFESAFGRRNFLVPVLVGAAQDWLPVVHPDFHGGVAYYLPALVFYEFGVAIAALFGVIAFAAFRIRSRLAVVSFLWTILAASFFLANPTRHTEWLVMMIVPAALIGAAGIDWIHHTQGWRFVRYPLAVLAVLSIYVQLTVIFVRVAPDPSEASWSRHMLLYWTDAATTTEAQQEFSHAERAVTDRGAVFFADDSPAAEWYLRGLRVADNISDAELIVSQAGTNKEANLLESYDFTLEERWDPTLANLTAAAAVRYFFTQATWSGVSGNDLRIDARALSPGVPPAPTPAQTPAAAVTASVSSPVSTPSGEPTVSAASGPTPAATNVSSPSPTASSSAMPSATPTPAP